MIGPPPLHLTPALSAETASLLSEATLLHQLVSALGSPLNVLLPQRIRTNVTAFGEVMAAHRIGGHVYYAHKANRSSALVRELAATDARIDVASPAELQHVLGAGFSPERIMATGPKTPEFVWLCARSGITVNVDGTDELALLGRIVSGARLPRVEVLVRFSEFRTAGTTLLTKPSRFGCGAEDLDTVLALLDKFRDEVRLRGVAFHLDTVGMPEKTRAIEGSLHLLDELVRRGHAPTVLDIGGGYGVNYLSSATEWDDFTTALGAALLGKRDHITWQGSGYGLRNDGGRLRGTLGLYPAHRPVAGPAYLDGLLSSAAPTMQRPLGTIILENMYDLAIEPGRALLDQCGFAMARVLEIRRSPTGEALVRMDMNARDVSLEEHGVQLDPVLVPRNSAPRPAGSGYLIGNLCLESDLISRRRIFFPAMPIAGDLLAFPNTAGYFMDFSADHALGQPVATKVAMYSEAGEWKWKLDDQYWPLSPQWLDPSFDQMTSQEP
ncbi:Y4yA family PLP-dependent enzyme [Gordonia sp. NPDC127522]|uniref:Y4yA family PLP-dependent enzyme n=1 Tax=Gordonia sp. NPDC127522 TaxID=3345390 RepID=UPI003635787B